MKKLMIVLLLVTYSFSNELTLGVVPQQSPLKLAKKWSKVSKYLYEQTGVKVVFKTESSIPKFEKKLYAGEYDISYMNPYHFTVAHKKKGYEAFTRAKKKIVGILLATKPIELTKEYLNGKVFLFPAPNAFAATLLTKFELKNKYNFDIEKEARFLYVNSHDSVYKGVSRQIGDIGGGIVRTFNNFKDNNDKDKLQVVYRTDRYPSHPIAAHPRVDKALVAKIQKAFLDMPIEIAKNLSIKEFIITDTKEYDAIKDIGVK